MQRQKRRTRSASSIRSDENRIFSKCEPNETRHKHPDGAGSGSADAGIESLVDGWDLKTRCVQCEIDPIRLFHARGGHEPRVLEGFVSRFLNLRIFLEQAGLSAEPSKFVMLCGALGFLGAFGWAALGMHVAFAPAVGGVLALLPLLVLLISLVMAYLKC